MYMKKIIPIIILMGILVLSSILYFVFQKDQSKMAEIFQGDTMNDKNILEKIVENPPQLQNTKTDEVGTASTSSVSVKTGTFIKIDPLHYASGNLRVEKSGENYKLVFADNFSSAPGPDLYVYLSSPQNYKNIALGGVDTSKTLNIGKLNLVLTEEPK